MLSPEVTFRHPVIRSTAYGVATPRRRREIHLAIAQATDAAADPDRQTWHLAAAASRPDERVAARLDVSAEKARLRGGYAAEMALLRRAVGLTPEPAARARRLLAAAEAALLAGEIERAQEFLRTAAPDIGSDPVMDATARRLRATALLAAGSADSLPAITNAARALEAVNPRAARDAWATALHTALLFDGSEMSDAVREIAAAAVATPEPASGEELMDLVLEACSKLVIDGRASAAPAFRRALDTPAIDRLPPAGSGAQAMMVTRLAKDQFDPDAGMRVLERIVDRDRRVGALDDLAIDLLCMHVLEAERGRLGESDALFERAQTVMEAVGSSAAWSLDNIETDAIRGRREQVLSAARGLRDQAISDRRGGQMAGINAALTKLYTGCAEYALAVESGRPVVEQAQFAYAAETYSYFIESAVRSGDMEAAAWAADRFIPRLEASGTPWALGLLAKCRALLAQPEEADALYVEAIDLLTGADVPLDLGRAHLLRGEALRRRRRRQEAADSLRAAHAIFSEIGAAGFAERARVELSAAGARPRRRGPDQRDVLTAQETQIARAAASGATNREIAAQMFLSEATVAYHLQKVYRKLDLSSRRELVPHLERISAPAG